MDFIIDPFNNFCRYNIRIENLNEDQLQLRERLWRIYSISGNLETVKGKGVIGQVLTIVQLGGVCHKRDVFMLFLGAYF